VAVQAQLERELPTELSRDLGMVSALAIGTGTMIAAGIFTLSGLAVGYVGSAAILSFLLAALVASFTALTYCEFTSIYPESGEGYLYARRTFAPPLAYLVGWCLLLGYTSSCAFYIASLSSYFNEFVWHVPVEQLPGLVLVAALTLLNVKGTKESGAFQVVVTIAKIILLLWFIAGGFSAVDAEEIRARFSTDLPLIASTGALVFITFFGFSAIAASAGEIQNPTRTVPRAIFWSMGIVTVLYSAVVLVVVAANLTEYTEAAMGVAAQAFLGPVGGMVIVGGALFSMISASNASILAGSRVALSMSQQHHLPAEIGAINALTGTPIMALLLVGSGIAGFAMLLPLESLAHFANCFLLLALTFVNVALVVHRRRFPEIERPFRVPLVPAVPILGCVANLYLLAQIPAQGHWAPLILAAIALLTGIAGFLVWKGTEFHTELPLAAPSQVLLERASTVESRYRVLVPIANPDNVDRLVRIAAPIAAAHGGEVFLLRVILVPDQLAPTLEESHVEREEEILGEARKRALEHGVAVSSQVRVAHDAGRAILEASRQRRCNLIVLGWRGSTSTTRRILGEVTDHVVNHAVADVILVKFGRDERPIGRILLPTAGGLHATRAESYTGLIARSLDAEVTLCSVLSPSADIAAAEQAAERLAVAAEHLQHPLASDGRPGTEQLAGGSNPAPPSGGPLKLRTEILRSDSVADAIVETAAEYDAVVIGAAGQSFSTQVLFGAIPEEIARRTDGTVIVVKYHQPVRALLGRVMTE
jgi:APA family basic amino acid/polyamine antiporter